MYRERRTTLRRQCLKRDGYKCVKCGSELGLECHHLIWLADGGPDTLDNVITLCSPCHAGVPSGLDETKEYLKIGLPPMLKHSCELTKEYVEHYLRFYCNADICLEEIIKESKIGIDLKYKSDWLQSIKQIKKERELVKHD